MNGFGNIISELEAQRAGIERALEALRALQQTGTAVDAVPTKRRGRPPGNNAKPRGGKRQMSAATRKRMSEGQRRRFAEQRAAAGTPQKSAAAPTKRRTMTAAGRKRLSELMKARWASKNPPKAGVSKRAE